MLANLGFLLRTMMEQRKKWAVVAGLSSVLLLTGLATSAFSQDITYGQDPNAQKRMTLLLKDFEPQPMIHVATHEVPRAKFPVIDVHNHVNDAGGILASLVAA